MNKLYLATSAGALSTLSPSTAQVPALISVENAGPESSKHSSFRKFWEVLQGAGVAVDAVDIDEIVRRGLSTSVDFGTAVPALRVQSGGGANSTFFLRGFGNFTLIGFSDPMIAFNNDDVYMGRPTSAAGNRSYITSDVAMEAAGLPRLTVSCSDECDAPFPRAAS
ncbi:hypothetical protein [Sphingobium sp. HWE2-09]|uniref:hypothetical protein n=1 Tax=Sphingobium sp. HWE2-09 TaxID=3108390 RepID=UPI002DC36CCF|nr:hypothetical protein [Sphingobium sp. HWE2-09]